MEFDLVGGATLLLAISVAVFGILVLDMLVHDYNFPTDKCTFNETSAAAWKILGYDIKEVTVYRDAWFISKNMTIMCAFEKE